jgi:hypothetical protein
MVFDDKFLEELPEDHIEALKKIFDNFEGHHIELGRNSSDNLKNYSLLNRGI